MDNQILLERILLWQEEPVFHELTCGNDSTHELLKGEVQDGEVVLVCPTCDYVQKKLPDIFYKETFDKVYAEQKEHYERIHGKKGEEPIDHIVIVDAASPICWWIDVIGQTCPVFEVYEPTGYIRIRTIRREKHFEHEPYYVMGWIPQDYVRKATAEEISNIERIEKART